MPDDTALMSASPSSLLQPDEGPPFEILNPDSEKPAVLIADHATRFIPRALGNLGLDEASLLRHIAWDIGIAEVTRALAGHLGVTAVLSRFSRLVIDPNRRLGTTASIPEVSDGVPVPGNRSLDAEARAQRAATFFAPYHAAIEGALQAHMTAGRHPVLISMHSFTPVLESVERPWKIGILWNEGPRLPRPLISMLRALDIPVGDNQPYSGRDAHGYSQHVHGDDHGLANALIEVRQDLIDTHHGAEEWAAVLGEILQAALADPELYTPFRSGGRAED